MENDLNSNNENINENVRTQPEPSKKKGSSAPEDKFLKDAENKVNKIMKDFTLLSELSIKHKGAYSEEHIEQIFRAIRKKVENTRKSFKMQDEDEDNFTFE